MNLDSSQQYAIEQAIIAGKKIEAIGLFREASGVDLARAKQAVEQMTRELQQEKPWLFKESDKESPVAKKTGLKISKKAILIFAIVDFMLFAALVYWFFLRQELNVDREQVLSNQEQEVQWLDGSDDQVHSVILEPVVPAMDRPKPVKLPEIIDNYTEALYSDDNFVSLYADKLNNWDYIERKSSRHSRSLDETYQEKKIKTYRSQLAAQRTLPAGVKAKTIAITQQAVTLDGVIDSDEWNNATVFNLSNKTDTRILLQSDGEWLYIACDAPQELTEKGYDQLRVYLHAGLIPELVNERVHVGSGQGITSIRQTTIRWQGEAPESDDERWKKYKISDWGIYHYAVGTSSLYSGHRQYEVAIYLEEAGIHVNAPFTLHAEVETDPLKNAQGKFQKRQYLGHLASEAEPLWLSVE